MPYRLVLVVTGGGTRAIPRLVARSGASKTVLEVSVPYHPQALAEYVGGRVDQACSEATVRRMAVAAYHRAVRLSTDGDAPAAGVACTAALATERMRRGRDRMFVAVHTRQSTRTLAVDFGHNQLDRDTEEMLAADAIARALGTLEISLELKSSTTAPAVEREQVAPIEWRELAEGEAAAVDAVRGRVYREAPVLKNQVLFPGSFDPLHEGHRQMAAIASERCGQQVTFELSIANADKPALDYLTIAERVAQFDDLPLMLTRSPRFDQKAELFPGSVFVIGADTAVRLADPRFYGSDPRRRDAALQRIAEAGCRFLLFGRHMDGGFAAPETLALPDAIRRICDCVSETQFRNDISSTQLRKGD